MEDVANQTYLMRRKAVYYFRMRIPHDISDTYKEKELCYSLKTKDYTKAIQMVRLEAAKAEQEFAHRRREKQRLASPPQDTISPEKLQHIYDLYYHHLLDEDDDLRADGFYRGTQKELPAPTFEEHKADTEALAGITKQDYAQAHSGVFFEGEAEEVLSWDGVGLNLTKGSAGFNKVVRKLQEATLRAQESIQKRNEGQIVDTPVEPLSGLSDSPVESDAPLLSNTIDEWLTDKSRTAAWVKKTRDSHELWVKAFLGGLGDKPIDQYTKSDAKAFRKALLQLPPRWNEKKELKGLDIVAAGAKAEKLGMKPMSLSNSRKIIGFVSGLWSWLMNHCDLEKNIFQGINIKVKKNIRDERHPFTIEELNTIFSSPLYTGSLAKNRPYDEGDYLPKDTARYWSPLIALFTGMRINEILQLHVSDIKEESGIHYFDILTAEDKRTKTEASNRRIPIHATLVAAGFLSFVNSRKSKRLFPELTADQYGAYSGSVSPFFSELLKRQGIKTDKLSFHSFRHTFEDACRENDVPKAIMDALQGHSEKGMSGRYGAGYSLQKLNEGLQKVGYGGLKLKL